MSIEALFNPGKLLNPSSLRRPSAQFAQTCAQVFDEENAVSRLQSFASLKGARFYGRKPNQGTVVVDRGDESLR